jgi:hypothetical protein
MVSIRKVSGRRASVENRIKWRKLYLTLALALLPSHAWASPAALYGVSCVTPGANNTTGPDATGNNFICNSGSVTWLPPAYQFGSTASSCTATTAGMVQWNDSVFQLCNGSSWGKIYSPSFSTYCTVASGLTCTGNSGAVWNNSASYSYVDVYICGGGGQGGGGLVGASSVAGGPGGGGGACVEQIFRASDLASTVTITLGSGGHTSTGSAAGQVGGNSTFGSYLTAYGGGGGDGASLNAAAGTGGDLFAVGLTGVQNTVNGFGGRAGSNGSGGFQPTSPWAGAGGGGSAGNGNPSGVGGNGWSGGPGGGAGGGVISSPNARVGTAGGKSIGCSSPPSGGAIGGGAGGASVNPTYVYMVGCGGAGGGGSNANSTSGGNGTAGTNAGGGGGGGATLSGGVAVGGNGGAGGDGFAVIKAW